MFALSVKHTIICSHMIIRAHGHAVVYHGVKYLLTRSVEGQPARSLGGWYHSKVNGTKKFLKASSMKAPESEKAELLVVWKLHNSHSTVKITLSKSEKIITHCSGGFLLAPIFPADFVSSESPTISGIINISP